MTVKMTQHRDSNSNILLKLEVFFRNSLLDSETQMVLASFRRNLYLIFRNILYLQDRLLWNCIKMQTNKAGNCEILIFINSPSIRRRPERIDFFSGVMRAYLFLHNGKSSNVFWGVYAGRDKSTIYMLLKQLKITCNSRIAFLLFVMFKFNSVKN